MCDTSRPFLTLMRTSRPRCDTATTSVFNLTRSPSRAADRGRETIVAAVDPIRLPETLLRPGGELIDEGEQRQLVGVGEEEPAQAEERRPQLLVGLDLVEPLRHRAAGEVGGDRRVPPLLGQTVGADGVVERLGQPIPSAPGRPRDDAGLAGRRRAVRSQSRRAGCATASGPVLRRASGSRAGPRRSDRRPLRRAGRRRTRREPSTRGRPGGCARRRR